MKLYLSDYHKRDNRIYPSPENRKSIEIESVCLDDYFSNYSGKIDFIKIDIQGAEAMAIQGMSFLLGKNKNLKIITEFWPFGLKMAGMEPAKYIELLEKQGFQLYQMNEQKKKIEPININELLKTYTPEKGNFTNLFCIKGY